tara:strand:- start:12914 stop:13105 length:192 start_codon:yes stop_codon:yes gene_type:complete
MQDYDEKAITGITAEVTIAQIEALSSSLHGLKERVLKKLIIGMDLDKVQEIINTQKEWIGSKK